MGARLVVARDDATAHRDVIERQSLQLRKILSMSREIAGSLSLRYVLRAVGTSASSVSGFDRVIIWLSNDDNTSLAPVFDSAATGRPQQDAVAEVGVGVVGQAVKYGRPATLSEGEEPSVEVHAERSLEAVALPLIVGARVSGAIELSSATPHLMTEGTLEVLETLAIHAAAAIEAARLHGEAERLGATDALTGLANRRTLDQELSAECERTARYHRPLAVIMFDVDQFKAFNDQFGHQRGDEVLQELSSLVVRELRNCDTAYRYGGEEFVVLARETTCEQATTLAERLRARIEAHFRAHGSLAPVTASFGIGVSPPSEPDPSGLIAVADAALYRAKGAGRNRVELPAPAS
jgi:diguanylate cyclase (GGDEF)-like protein